MASGTASSIVVSFETSGSNSISAGRMVCSEGSPCVVSGMASKPTKLEGSITGSAMIVSGSSCGIARRLSSATDVVLLLFFFFLSFLLFLSVLGADHSFSTSASVVLGS